MKIFLTTIILISTCSHAQDLQQGRYKYKNQVISTDSIRVSDILGDFSQGDMFEGYTYSMLPNRTFKKTGYSDIPDYPKPDSGNWKLKGKDKLIIYTWTKKTVIKVLKIGEYCFLIFPDKQKYFDDELNNAFISYKDVQTITIPGTMNATLFLIGHALSKKFFSRRLTTGT